MAVKICHILNSDALDAAYDENLTLEDREEAAVREALLDAIGDSVVAYNKHVIEYEYRQYCKKIEDRGLIFRPVDKKTVAEMWDCYFAADLSAETRKKIFYDSDFKWHMFSYGKTAARTGADARRAFNRCKKGAAYLFIECTDEAWFIENSNLLKAKDFEVDYYFEREDIYIFDVEGKWAYAKTHESDCGPYFMRRK